MVEVNLKTKPVRGGTMVQPSVAQTVFSSPNNFPGEDEDAQSFTSNMFRWRLLSRPHVWRPPTDVFETDTQFIVRVEVAGMREQDFLISLEDKHLLIGGTRLDQPERRAYYQMEIPFGEFSTEVELPGSVVADGVEAVYRDGFLRIVLVKAKPHHIQIKE